MSSIGPNTTQILIVDFLVQVKGSLKSAITDMIRQSAITDMNQTDQPKLSGCTAQKRQSAAVSSGLQPGLLDTVIRNSLADQGDWLAGRSGVLR